MKNKTSSPEEFVTSLAQTSLTSQGADSDAKQRSPATVRKPKRERAKLVTKEVLLATKEDDEELANRKKIREAIEELKITEINETNFIHVVSV